MCGDCLEVSFGIIDLTLAKSNYRCFTSKETWEALHMGHWETLYIFDRKKFWKKQIFMYEKCFSQKLITLFFRNFHRHAARTVPFTEPHPPSITPALHPDFHKTWQYPSAFSSKTYYPTQPTMHQTYPSASTNPDSF